MNRKEAVIGVFAIMGIITMLFATRYGVGISPDSVVYIGGARNLLSGQGISKSFGAGEIEPITHYPPLFSISIALPGYFGLDLINVVRWLNALLFGANIMLVGLMMKRYTSSLKTSILGSIFMLTSVDMLFIHSMAWSEPLFIFFTLLGLNLLILYIEKSRLIFLISTACIMALGFLTRYIGVVLIFSGIVAILLLNRETIRKRILNSIVFTCIGCLPIVVWFLRNFYVAGTITNRKISFHPISLRKIKFAFQTISVWILPEKVPSSVRLTFLLIFFACLLVMVRMVIKNKKYFKKQNFLKKISVLAIFIFVYMMFLVISISFFDAYTPIDNRILSPVYATGMIIVLCTAYKMLKFIKDREVYKRILLGVLIIFTGLSVIRGAIWVVHRSRDGNGYTKRIWKESEIIKWIRDAVPTGTPIYTNGADAIYIHTWKPARFLPRKIDPCSRKINYNYLSELSAMKKDLENQKGVLVYFKALAWRWYFPSEEELRKRLPLRLLFRTPYGSVYVIVEE